MTSTDFTYDDLPVREWSLTDRDGSAVTFEGSLLGTGTSFQSEHSHVGDVPERGTRCSACRWFDVSIFESTDEDTAMYVVYTVGRSIVPGESDRPKIAWTDSAYEIVELLTTRKDDVPRVPKPSLRALAQASQYDEDIAEACQRRNVAELRATYQSRHTGH